MLIISHDLTPQLKKSLVKISSLRKKILLIPVSPQTELILTWQATLSHIEGWANLSNQPLSNTYIQNVITHSHSRTTSSQATKVLNYKQALDYIRLNWSANSHPVTFKTIVELAKILQVSYPSEREITPLLTYLQSGEVNPIIQSATAHLFFSPNRLSYLTSLLFLAKYGYHLRGLLSLEDRWNEDKDHYLLHIQEATESADIAPWLEYYCQGLLHQMEKIHTSLTNPPKTSHAQLTAFWQISKRQQLILDQIHHPDISITNKMVQKAFKIHQITASRDLAKLATLGLLTSHGHGRSTKYSKV